MGDPDPISNGLDGKTTVGSDGTVNGDTGAGGPEQRLLPTDGSTSTSLVSGDVETPSPRSISFRQRATLHLNSPHGADAAASNGGGGDNRFLPFAIDREAGGGSGMVHSESRAKLEADGEYVPNAISVPLVLKTLFLIFLWYTFSTCLTLYNKTLLGEKLGKFPAPLLMNTVHFTMQAVLSQIVVCFQNRKSGTASIMTWKDYFVRVVPTALGTALDINLSNASLVFISVTFATMCKSASPIFLLLFAFAFRLESPSIKLFGIIFIISIGVLLTVAKETQFELVGFILVILSSVMSGFRWSMTQILLQKEVYGLKNPFTLMSYVAPVMAVSTLVCSLAMDPWDKFENNVYFDNFWHVARSCLLMALGGTLAFFMVLTEYILVSATSAVTVTIAGVVKEAVTILVAVFYFHDQFNLLKALGLFIILVGVSLFNWYKYLKFKRGQLNGNEEDTLPIANSAAKYVILDDADLLDDDI